MGKKGRGGGSELNGYFHNSDLFNFGTLLFQGGVGIYA